MFKTNQYFDGNVMSMAFENEEGRATVGIMSAGEYEFGTSTIEYMTVVSGEMTVLLPGSDKWKTFKPFETFMVEKDSKFKLIIHSDCAYKCIYK
jgi:purine/pyrimidine-nucleoside phosphorylase